MPKRSKRHHRVRKSLAALTALLLVALIIVGLYSYEPIAKLLPKLPFLEGSPETTEAPTTTEGNQPPVVASGNLSFHFLELGNKYAGDCTYVKAGDVDILIDAGSRTSSVSTIDNYLKQYVTDGVLEYVIVTHAHQDHYAGFATSASTDSLFDLYECETIIDFALTNQKDTAKMYSNYVRERSDEIANGATHYTAADCIKSDKSVFDLGGNVTLTILDSYYYYNKASSENDYSVCCLFTEGDRSFLFTGDLEAEGEEHLVEMNALPEIYLYKAGHHGSKTSSSEEFLSVIQPKIVCVCCCCGSPEYTDTPENQFPTQEFIDHIAVYTREVYVTTLCLDYENDSFTSMNGNIVVTSSPDGVTVSCSGSDEPLYQSEWFQNNRVCPNEWMD